MREYRGLSRNPECRSGKPPETVARDTRPWIGQSSGPRVVSGGHLHERWFFWQANMPDPKDTALLTEFAQDCDGKGEWRLNLTPPIMWGLAEFIVWFTVIPRHVAMSGTNLLVSKLPAEGVKQ